MTKEKEQYVPASELCALFRCDESMVRRLARAGIVVRIGPGKYLFDQSISNYIAHLREVAAGRGTSDASGLNLSKML